GDFLRRQRPRGKEKEGVDLSDGAIDPPARVHFDPMEDELLANRRERFHIFRYFCLNRNYGISRYCQANLIPRSIPGSARTASLFFFGSLPETFSLLKGRRQAADDNRLAACAPRHARRVRYGGEIAISRDADRANTFFAASEKVPILRVSAAVPLARVRGRSGCLF